MSISCSRDAVRGGEALRGRKAGSHKKGFASARPAPPAFNIYGPARLCRAWPRRSAQIPARYRPAERRRAPPSCGRLRGRDSPTAGGNGRHSISLPRQPRGGCGGPRTGVTLASPRQVRRGGEKSMCMRKSGSPLSPRVQGRKKGTLTAADK